MIVLRAVRFGQSMRRRQQRFIRLKARRKSRIIHRAPPISLPRLLQSLD
jgi:hypothetical protein